MGSMTVSAISISVPKGRDEHPRAWLWTGREAHSEYVRDFADVASLEARHGLTVEYGPGAREFLAARLAPALARLERRKS